MTTMTTTKAKKIWKGRKIFITIAEFVGRVGPQQSSVTQRHPEA